MTKTWAEGEMLSMGEGNRLQEHFKIIRRIRIRESEVSKLQGSWLALAQGTSCVHPLPTLHQEHPIGRFKSTAGEALRPQKSKKSVNQDLSPQRASCLGTFAPLLSFSCCG